MKIFLVFICLCLILFSKGSFANETPKILIGDWYLLNYECGSANSIGNSWRVGENFLITSANGIHECKFEKLKYYDTSANKAHFGEWSFEEHCTNKSKKDNKDYLRYGWMRVYKFKEEIRLDIHTRDNGAGGIFEAPQNPAILQLKKCN